MVTCFSDMYGKSCVQVCTSRLYNFGFFCFSRTIETHNRHKKDKLYKFFNVIQSEPEGPLYEGHVKGRAYLIHLTFT